MPDSRMSRTVIPAPNAYNQSMRVTWRSAPSYTLKGRAKSAPGPVGPPPNAHRVSQEQTWRRAPSYSMKPRT